MAVASADQLHSNRIKLIPSDLHSQGFPKLQRYKYKNLDLTFEPMLSFRKPRITICYVFAKTMKNLTSAKVSSFCYFIQLEKHLCQAALDFHP